jgi:hypothetical protein
LRRLEPVDEALVTAVLELAKGCDEAPTRASLWKEYRESLAMLLERTAGDSDDFQQLLDSLRSEVGDSKKR